MNSSDVEIAGATAGQFDQVNVNGSVNLALFNSGEAMLNVSKSSTLILADGNQLVIIANDGADAVTGTFKNLPEGANLGSNFLGTGLTATISYVGGTGNDVSIEVSPGSLLPWHNEAKALDVNGGRNNAPDDHVVAGDALAVINYLNAFGSGAVPASAVLGLPFGFLDTDEDNFVTAADALDVINFLNAGLGGEGEGGGYGVAGFRVQEMRAGAQGAVDGGVGGVVGDGCGGGGGEAAEVRDGEMERRRDGGRVNW